MNRPASDARDALSLRQQAGGALLLLGGTWTFLVMRDYYFGVLAPDANSVFLDEDYRTRILINVIVALLGATAGLLIFLTGRKDSSKRSSHRRTRRGSTTPVVKSEPPSGEPANPNDLASTHAEPTSPAAGNPNRVKVRCRVRAAAAQRETMRLNGSA